MTSLQAAASCQPCYLARLGGDKEQQLSPRGVETSGCFQPSLSVGLPMCWLRCGPPPSPCLPALAPHAVAHGVRVLLAAWLF